VTQPDANSLLEPALRRVRLRVAYHGAAFRGFAINRDVASVEGLLTEVISTVARHKVHIDVAGRTDAGVHARGQVITVDIPAHTNLSTFMRSVNALCKPHVAVSDAQWVDSYFDARYSAIWRRYRYTVNNADAPDPMLIDRAWHVSRPLSIPLMNLACDPLIGEHDFSAFCRRPDQIAGAPVPSMHRRVYSAKWTQQADHILVFEIRANAFCYQMVRSFVGFLVDVGLGYRPPSDTRAVLLAGDRAHGSQVAPAAGLTLWDVGYPGEPIPPFLSSNPS